MARTECYHCGAIHDEGSRCAACGRELDSAVAQRLRAARDLAAQVCGDRRLSDELRAELDAVLLRHLAADLAAARVAAEREDRLAPAAIEPRGDTAVEPRGGAASAHDRSAGRAGSEPPHVDVAPRTPGVRRPFTPREGSRLWARIGPVFTENLLFTLAVFLMVVGAIYFVTTAWTTMTGTARLCVVFAAVEAFGLGMVFAGRALNRAGSLPEVERVLATVAALLAPIAGLVAGRLAIAAPWLGVAAALISVGVAAYAARAVARGFAEALHHGFVRSHAGFAALAAMVPWVAAAPIAFAAFTAGLLMWTSARAVARVVADPGSRAAAPWVAALVLGCAALSVVAGVALHALGAAAMRTASAGVVLAAIGWSVARIEVRGRAAASAIAAIAVAIAGCGIASGDPRALLVASSVATWTAVVVALRLGRAAALWPAAVLSAVAYVLLPAPVRELAAEVRAWFAGSLGYTPERLPVSFYGLTFLPYTAAVALLAAWWTNRGRAAFARVALAWTLAIASGLAVLAIVAGDDARAPAAVLGAEGIVLAALGWFTRRQRLVFAGAAGLAGSMFALVECAQLTPMQGVVVLAALGLAAVGAVAWMQRGAAADGFRIQASHAVLDAIALAALALAWLAIGNAPGARGSPLLLASAQGAVALLVACVARSHALAGLGVLAWLHAAIGLRALAIDPMWSMLASLAPAWTLGVRAAGLAGLLPRRREGRAPGAPGAPGVGSGAGSGRAVVALVGTLLLQGFAVPHLVADLAAADRSIRPVLACVLGAGAWFALALASRWSIVSVLAGIQLVAAALAGVLVADGRLDGFAGAVGLGTGAFTIALVSLAIERHARATAAFAPAMLVALTAAGLAVVRSALLRIGGPSLWLSPSTALEFVAASGLPCLLVFATRFPPASARRSVAAAIASIAVPLTAIAVCDVLAVPAAWYPLGLVVAAVVVWRGPQPIAAWAVVVHLLASAALASVVWWHGLATAAVLALTFASIAAVGRIALGAVPIARSLAVVFGGFAALWFGLSAAEVGVDRSYLPAIALGWTSLVLALTSWRPSGIERVGAACLAGPVTVAAGIWVLLELAGAVSGAPFATAFASAPRVAGALGLVALGLSHGSVAQPAKRARWRILGLAAASVVVPLLTAAVAGSTTALAPALELAVLAVAVAGLARPATLPSDRADRAGSDAARAGARRVAAAYAFAVLAIASTRLDLAWPATPWTMAVVSCAPLVLAVRRRAPRHVEWACHGWLLTSLVTTVHVAPLELGSGLGSLAGLLAHLAAVAATLGVVWTLLESHVRRRGDDAARGGVAWSSSRVLATSLARAWAGTALCALVLLGIDVGTHAGSPATGMAVAAVLIALLAVIGSATLRARIRDAAAPVHAAVLAAIAGHAFFATRTAWLDGLAGRHLLVLVLIGGVLLAMSRALRASRPAAASALRIDGLLLPVPAILVHVALPSPEAALALLLAATVYGHAAALERARWLGWSATALLNAGVFSLWLHQGVVDAALYGVPLGLSLVVGAELMQRATSRAVLATTGFVVLFGSLAVQVARVEQPLHALLLFVAGLLAIAHGFARRRADHLLVGTVAVVVDVVAYLMRHGLQRDFLGAGLLIASGITVLVVAAASRRLRQARG